THDQVEAMTMGDRIVVLKDGVIHQVDDPVTVYLRPVDRFVAGFIGSPPMNFFTGRLRGSGPETRFEKEGLSVPCAAEHRKALEQWEGLEVIYGIRPEDVLLARSAPDVPPGDRIAAMIEVVEPMGSEVYVYFNASGNAFIGRVAPRERVGVGERIEVYFDTAKAHYFDPDSGETIV
nr:TOBE domain-containing protein [bacterium]